ncbi:MAG: hypothetical protein DI586_10615 [Micavibrio aeruginosavorus]|uniref:Dihydroneopterin aldolase/epimerase domain-containing protein n=1 Tax=Micavibrio aeruginosavorus TaxID=349221 RepID=A0A2W5FCQ1_9BACT|nr:MAG: hypothetical protein DI586_10615 [Micavibrio aeruginosavorus]
MSNNQTKIFIRDFKIDALAGIFPGDEINPTSLSISVEAVFADYKVVNDDISSTMSYDLIATEIREISRRHFNLIEKMAEHLAEFCLKYDRVASVKVKIEKLKMYPEGFSGTEIIRLKGTN